MIIFKTECSCQNGDHEKVSSCEECKKKCGVVKKCELKILGIRLRTFIPAVVVPILILYMIMIAYSVYVIKNYTGPNKWLKPAIITLLVLWLPLFPIAPIILIFLLFIYRVKSSDRIKIDLGKILNIEPTASSTGPTASSIGPTASSTGPTASSTGPTASSTGPTASSTGPTALSSEPTASSTEPPSLELIYESPGEKPIKPVYKESAGGKPIKQPKPVYKESAGGKPIKPVYKESAGGKPIKPPKLTIVKEPLRKPNRKARK